jgi:hypothetical protein
MPSIVFVRGTKTYRGIEQGDFVVHWFAVFLTACSDFSKSGASDRGKSLALVDGSGEVDRGYGERAGGSGPTGCSLGKVDAGDVPNGSTDRIERRNWLSGLVLQGSKRRRHPPVNEGVLQFLQSTRFF